MSTLRTKGLSMVFTFKNQKRKSGGQKMASSRLKEFDCNVLHDEKGKPDAGITLFGAAFGSPNYIRALLKKVSTKVQDILAPSKNLKNPQIAFHLQRYCASTCLVSHLLRSTPPGLFKTLRFLLGHDFPRGFCFNT